MNIPILCESEITVLESLDAGDYFEYLEEVYRLTDYFEGKKVLALNMDTGKFDAFNQKIEVMFLELMDVEVAIPFLKI
jgi:hypothetical protein